MRNLALVILLALGLVSPVQAELDGLLAWQQQGDSGAYISSGFHDWRTVSKYRRHPGLHAGYDIAMLAGSPVRAAWPGVVVAITPWYGAEYGVTVQSPNGYEATYGHISPGVSLGDTINTGTILGAVVVDHVDVKMRDSLGGYVDFKGLNFDLPRTEPKAETAPPRDLSELKAKLKELGYELERKERAFEHGLVSRKTLHDMRHQVEALRELTGVPLSAPAAENTTPTELEKHRSRADFLIQRAVKSVD